MQVPVVLSTCEHGYIITDNCSEISELSGQSVRLVIASIILLPTKWVLFYQGTAAQARPWNAEHMHGDSQVKAE